MRSASASSASPSHGPTSRRAARALPPTASAAWTDGGETAANARDASARAASDPCDAFGQPHGTEVDRLDPARVRVRGRRRRSRSTRRRRRRRRSVAAAERRPWRPLLRRRAGPLPRSRGSAPNASPHATIASSSSSAFPLCRPGAVRKTSSVSAPPRRATLQSLPTAFAAAAMLTSDTTPLRSISAPSDRRTRSFSIGTSSRPSICARSRRMVFEPTSTTPIRTSRDGRPPVGGRLKTSVNRK